MLQEYGLDKYTSVHLKNPECSFYYDTIDGDKGYASAESIFETRTLLQTLANLSSEGMYLFLVYSNKYIPESEMENYYAHQFTDCWEPVPYIFPDGYIISTERTRVFHIEDNL